MDISTNNLMKTLIKKLDATDVDSVISYIINNNRVDLAYIFLIYRQFFSCRPNHKQRIHLLNFIVSESNEQLSDSSKKNLIRIAKITKNNDELSLIILAIEKTKKLHYIYDFAKTVSIPNVQEIEDAFFRVISQNKDGTYSQNLYCYLFARDVPGANINRFQQTIIQNNNLPAILEFALDIKDANFTQLEQTIIKLNDPCFIFSLAYNSKRANIEKLQNAIINTKNSEYICWFALLIKKSDTQKLKKVILSLDDKKWKCIFLILLFSHNSLLQHHVFHKLSIDAKYTCPTYVY